MEKGGVYETDTVVESSLISVEAHLIDYQEGNFDFENVKVI